MTRETILPLGFFILTALLSLLIFISIMHFLTQRYAIIAALLAITLLPSFLDAKYQQYFATENSGKFYAIFGFITFYCLVDSLFSFGYSKQYMVDAAIWTQENIPQTASYKTNSYLLAYESGLVEDYDHINTDKQSHLANLERNEYLALVINGSETNLKNKLDNYNGLELLQEFSNKRLDTVRIYQFLPE